MPRSGTENKSAYKFFRYNACTSACPGVPGLALVHDDPKYHYFM